jgi:thiamine biosynthesis lipoprotein
MYISYFQTNIALGSSITLTIVADEQAEKKINQLFTELWRAIFVFEKQFSRFLPNSELSQFNQKAGTQQPVTPEFHELLTEAKRLSEATVGLFNPFILPALQRAGYKKSVVPGYENDFQYDYSKLHVAEPKDLKIGDTWASIPHGTAIDMGGCGKGYLADQLAKMVKQEKVLGYWLSLGGDVVGSGYDEHGKPFAVEIRDSPDESAAAQWEVRTVGKEFAVATSGTNIRKGVHEGKAWHHILDPRTQLPAETDLTTASIYGTSGVEADVLASSAIILGSKKAGAFLKKFPSVKGYILQGWDSDDKKVEVKHGRAIGLKQLISAGAKK